MRQQGRLKCHPPLKQDPQDVLMLQHILSARAGRVCCVIPDAYDGTKHLRCILAGFKLQVDKVLNQQRLKVCLDDLVHQGHNRFLSGIMTPTLLVSKQEKLEVSQVFVNLCLLFGACAEGVVFVPS
jgi:hypothetical protein